MQRFSLRPGTVVAQSLTYARGDISDNIGLDIKQPLAGLQLIHF